jgi:hypothetical protein
MPKYFKLNKFLNKGIHASSSSIQAYYGKEPWKLAKKNDILMYLRISSCHSVIDIHPNGADSLLTYIKKLKRLVKYINRYIDFLETKL